MRKFVAGLLAVGLAACSERGAEQTASDGSAGEVMKQSVEAMAPPAMAASSAPVSRVAGSAAQISRDTGTTGAPVMIIRTGHASVEVRNVDEAIVKLRALVTGMAGHVANSSFEGGEHNVRSATLELKIPAARYDDAVAGLSAIGEVESVNSSSEDVGEEYVDVTARIANAKRLEERLIQLLATRTGRLEDVLAVERELARVREEIERAEGRLRYLRTRAAMSTLTVTAHEDEPILGRAGDNPIVAAFKAAWRNFVRFVAGLIAAMGIIVPVAALVAGAYWIGRKVRAKK